MISTGAVSALTDHSFTTTVTDVENFDFDKSTLVGKSAENEYRFDGVDLILIAHNKDRDGRVNYTTEQRLRYVGP